MHVLRLTETSVVPTRATEGSAGYDLHADESVWVRAGKSCTVSTGIALAIPHGYEGQVRSRSGLASKTGVVVLNSPGTIDSDYRGEVKVILYNSSFVDYKVKKGDRIAQIVFAKHEKPSFMEVNELPVSTTRSGGFGHTGV